MNRKIFALKKLFNHPDALEFVLNNSKKLLEYFILTVVENPNKSQFPTEK